MIGCSNKRTLFKFPSEEKTTTQSENLDKKIIESWGRQKDFFIENNFEIISWEDAENKLLGGEYCGGKQYHTGWLTIYSLEGNKYLTKQPRIDAYWQFMKDNNLSTEGFGTE